MATYASAPSVRSTSEVFADFDRAVREYQTSASDCRQFLFNLRQLQQELRAMSEEWREDLDEHKAALSEVTRLVRRCSMAV